MSRIPTPATIEATPAAAQPLLEAVKKQIGSVPNLFRLTATSPAALDGYLSLNGALAKGAPNAATRPIVLGDAPEFSAYVDRIHRQFERMGVLHGNPIQPSVDAP